MLRRILFSDKQGGERIISEVPPNSWDKEMIAGTYEDNSEEMDLDDFVRSLGFEPYELQNQD